MPGNFVVVNPWDGNSQHETLDAALWRGKQALSTYEREYREGLREQGKSFDGLDTDEMCQLAVAQVTHRAMVANPEDRYSQHRVELVPVTRVVNDAQEATLVIMEFSVECQRAALRMLQELHGLAHDESITHEQLRTAISTARAAICDDVLGQLIALP